MVTDITADPTEEYRDALRDLKAALEAEENIVNLEFEVEQTAKEFDAISEQYENKLNDLHDEIERIKKNAEAQRQRERSLQFQLPLSADDQERVSEARQQIQQLKPEIHKAHEDRQQKRFALDQLERELSRPNRRKLPEDQQTLEDAQLALRHAHDHYETLVGRLRHNEWLVEHIYYNNAKRFI